MMKTENKNLQAQFSVADMVFAGEREVAQLMRKHDVPFALLYLTAADGKSACLVGASTFFFTSFCSCENDRIREAV